MPPLARATGALVAIITSAKNSDWPFDVAITDLICAGLKLPCLVRTKLNAIDLPLIARKFGTLGAKDRRGVSAARDAGRGAWRSIGTIFYFWGLH